MAVVIGAGTSASFAGACVISAQWGFNPNTQRLYCLDGTYNPYMIINRPTEVASVTIYSPGPSYSTEPTQGCSDAGTISFSVNPAVCGVFTGGGVSGLWFVTSYNFSKNDPNMPGQESWSLQRWVTGDLSGVVLPSYVLRGISEGQGTDNAGLTFTGETSNSTTGNVSAGGFGTAYDITVGQVIAVGGGQGVGGETGTGSANIPYTPLYI